MSVPNVFRYIFSCAAALLLVGIFWWPSPSHAQEPQMYCCIIGPGNCFNYDANNPNPNVPPCTGTHYPSSDCQADFAMCRQTPTANIQCCVCPSPTTGESTGTCVPAARTGPPCGQMQCTQSEKVCTQIEQCLTWWQPEKPAETKKLVSFIPSVTIPGSKYFNKGVPITITGNTLGEYIAALFLFFVSVAGILATVMIMYGGVKYVVSFGNPQKISDAKDTITSAMLGLAIALGSYVILMTINPNLVQFKGLTEVTEITPIPQFEDQGESEKGAPAVAWTGQNVTAYDQYLTDAAHDNGLDRDWLKALMLVESNGDPTARSPKGACGLIQLMEDTASRVAHVPITCGMIRCSQDDPLCDIEVRLNIDIAAKYYISLLIDPCPSRATYRSGRTVACYPDQTDCRAGNPLYANAAYNGGQDANCSSITCPAQTWWECELNPGFKETRDYVQKVQTAYDKVKTFGWSIPP